MNAETVFTAADIVKRYIELRNFKQQREKEHEVELQPYKDAMIALEGMANQMLIDTGQKALSTEHGTAFYKDAVSVTCEDHDAFLRFVREVGAWNMLTKHVSKEAVEAWIEERQKQLDAIGERDQLGEPLKAVPPPGVKVDYFKKVQFRKS